MSNTEKFEHYEVLKREDGSLFELGRGAMGITYKALDTDLECFVALKIINPATIADKDAEQRFSREARSAAQLRHPNIASVFRLGKTDDGTHYYAMEFCEGQTLQQLVEQSGPIECRRALQFTLQVTKALIVAEERHLVHRDLKPSNLIVTQRSDEGEVIKVIDFGLAKTTAPDGTMWSSLGTHGFIGTAHFASPEQIEDKPVDTRSDIYSLGSTLWFMLLGKPPFEGSLARIMSQHLTAEPDFSHLHGAPEKVITLLRRMLEKSAEDRPQTALELRTNIVDCLETLEQKENAEEPERATSSAEPPPLPIFASVESQPSEPAPEEPWTPSLVEILRVRGVLSPPPEVFRIGETLAAQLDQDLESSGSALRIQDITIHFQDSPTAEQMRERLREHVTAWPPFELVIEAGDAAPPSGEVDPSLMTTIVPGEDFTGDKAQQLARLLYELLGGPAGAGRYVPVARLGEAGNAVLQRAAIVGLAGYPTVRELIDKLREASAPAAAPAPIPTPVRAAATSSESKTPASTVPKAAPVVPETAPKTRPASQPSNPASIEPHIDSSSEPPRLPPPSSPGSTPASKKAGGSSRVKIAVRILAAAAGLFAIFDGIKTFRSGLSDSHAAKQTEVAPPTSAPSTPAPIQTTADSSDLLTPERANTSPATPAPAEPTVAAPAAPVPVAAAAGPLQFTIYDDLGVGQISESVQVYLDNQTEPASTISLTPQQPHGAAVVNLPSAGHHAFTVKTESVAIDLTKGSKKILSSGRWEYDLRGGEKYDLSATPQDNVDSYKLAVTPRN